MPQNIHELSYTNDLYNLILTLFCGSGIISLFIKLYSGYPVKIHKIQNFYLTPAAVITAMLQKEKIRYMYSNPDLLKSGLN
jgi:hypothetical protein